mmetsp:Transcript_11239/g.18337  ORF Transcript_11239/g.18337 Transcript_11239/m.18337 type:complete len:120 (+) Transcript_11239:1118-1477(+)
MGRIRPFVLGGACGLGGYFVMHQYTVSRFTSIENGLRGLRREINPEAPSHNTKSGAHKGWLGEYKEQAAQSFRKNWNDTVRNGYEKFVSAVRNPYLNVGDKKELPNGGDQEKLTEIVKE